MKRVVETSLAPAAVGPYSQAVIVGRMLYTSGQIPLLPDKNELVNQDITAATRQVLSNLTAVLRAAGASLEDVVKVTIYLADMADLAQMNQVYAEYFQGSVPARSTVAVAGLPRDARIEIEAIACLPPEAAAGHPGDEPA